MNRTAQRTGTAVAGLLAADAALHLYWATGLTWPAADGRALSQAVLNADVPFTPPVVLPLAALLLAAAAAVLAHAQGLGGPRTARLCRPATAAVAAGLLLRGAAGLAWACGVGTEPGSTFHLLNLVLYTPLCLGFGAAAALTAGAAGAGSRRPVRDFRRG
ncbi:DUF3995 domain-containing protein [Streptomyces sp. NRRL B-24484]|uniref:DUF3995 domain-containing protein n=1 Tax=Streptomyces sp. NRRL B-24484 TaxID=1463833 RepID=UPI000997E464|nr:DUF3995 domain-containing protein [Streptomyces sp. NRRL B-24484]